MYLTRKGCVITVKQKGHASVSHGNGTVPDLNEQCDITRMSSSWNFSGPVHRKAFHLFILAGIGW